MYHFDPPRLRRCSPSSFGTDDVAAVASLLEQHGFSPLQPQSNQTGRLIRGGSIALLYPSGRVLCRGSDAQALIALLHQAARASDELLGEV